MRKPFKDCMYARSIIWSMPLGWSHGAETRKENISISCGHLLLRKPRKLHVWVVGAATWIFIQLCNLLSLLRAVSEFLVSWLNTSNSQGTSNCKIILFYLNMLKWHCNTSLRGQQINCALICRPPKSLSYLERRYIQLDGSQLVLNSKNSIWVTKVIWLIEMGQHEKGHHKIYETVSITQTVLLLKLWLHIQCAKKPLSIW